MVDRQRFANRREAGGNSPATSLATRVDRMSSCWGSRAAVCPSPPAVARVLGAPLDVFLVRKLGVPGHDELAFGAIAEGGIKVLSAETMRQLDIPARAAETVAVRERLELDRRGRLYRGDRPAPTVRDRVVIVIDDGLATGATMEAAVLALRQLEPARVVVAAPVGARETCQRLRRVADEVVCPVHTRTVLCRRPLVCGLLTDDRRRGQDRLGRRRASAQPPARRLRAPGDHRGRHGRARSPACVRGCTGDPDEYDGLLNLIGDARGRPHRRGDPRHARVLPRTRAA